MNHYRITVLKGDGIGPEIVDQAMKVLDKAAAKHGFAVEYDQQLLGGAAIDATGMPLPQATVDACKASDSVLLGAVGGPKWDSQPGGNRPEAGLLGIRMALGLYANLRPAVIFAPCATPPPSSPRSLARAWTLWWSGSLPAAFTLATGARKSKTA
jgi:3-isopropylmalate dehydrogenase